MATFHSEISQLKKEIKLNGWNKRLPGRMAFELVFHLTLMTGGIWWFIETPNIFLKMAAMLVSTIGAIGITTHTHSSSHHTTFNSRWLNDALVYFGYTFLFGTSAHYWWNKHIVVHHPNPNVYDIDDDIDLKPFLAFTRDEVEQSNSKFQKWVFKYQGFIFPIALLFNGFNIQLSGWKYLLPLLFDNKQRKPEHWLDLFVLFLHWFCSLVLPCLWFSFSDVFIFHCIRISMLGYGMYVAFAPAHFPAEAAVLDTHNKDADYYIKQLATTVNFKTGAFGRLLCAGVDYQIEHHLFPGVTHTYYPEVGKRLKAICNKYGYPYRELGWWEAIWKSYIVFFTPKPVYENAETFIASPH